MAKIFIESTWNQRRKEDGVAMWLIEVEEKTLQGFIHQEDGQKTQGELKALINAFMVLKRWKPEETKVSIFTECDTIANAVSSAWHIQWRKKGWKNSKGKDVPYSDLWEMFLEKSHPIAYSVAAGHHEYTNVMKMQNEQELQQWLKQLAKSRNERS